MNILRCVVWEGRRSVEAEVCLARQWRQPCPILRESEMQNIDIQIMRVMLREHATRCFAKKSLRRSGFMMKCLFAIKMMNSTTGLPNMVKKSLFLPGRAIAISFERHPLNCFVNILNMATGGWQC